MGASFFTEQAENARRSRADDARFLEYGIYFFELIFPTEAVKGGNPTAATESYLFPLILNPESISVEERFTVSKVPTTGGGMYVEENGILERQLVIKGHTGFKPRLARAYATPAAGSPGVTVYPTTNFSVPDPSFRERGRSVIRDAISGQRHFQFLQDKVFRIYGDLKRTPAFSEQTILNWHNSKDQEHFRVIPEKFTMTRDIRRKFLYQYEIVCTIVDKAEERSVLFVPEDKDIFDQISDGVAIVRKGIDFANSVSAEITGFIGEIEGAIRGIESAVNGLIDVVDGVTAAVDSVTRLGSRAVTLPFRTVTNAINTVENLVQTTVNLPFRVRDAFNQSLLQMTDAASHFAFMPELYEPNPVEELLRAGYGQTKRVTVGELADSAANPPQSIAEYEAGLGGPGAGEETRVNNPLYATTTLPTPKSASIQVVQGGDSIAALAARYLGDARRWRELAAFNKLQHPYISKGGEPNTLRPGNQILVPSESPTQNATRTPGIFPGDPNVASEERTLGRDFKLTPDRQGFYDFSVADGGEDFDLVAGVENLSQALTTRVTTEQGTSTLYKNMGYKPLIGIGSGAVDQEIARIRLGDAILADPRITALTELTFLANVPADAVQVRIEAGVRGFQEPLKLTTESKDIPLYTS